MKEQLGQGCSSVVGHMQSVQEALSSISTPRPPQKDKKDEKYKKPAASCNILSFPQKHLQHKFQDHLH
jgi:hypothetical protein